MLESRRGWTRWLIRVARGAVMICHGNAENLSDGVARLGLYHRLGYSVLLFDYRGYGRSEGSPSEAGTYADAKAAWDYLGRIQV